MKAVTIIGGGLAGSEAALQLARHGIPVDLFEMRPRQMTEAHKTGNCAELVCSNSFGSLSDGTASQVLKRELDLLGSSLLPIARKYAVPAGASLAVDREKFSQEITSTISKNPLIRLCSERIDHIPSEGQVIIATGPLTTPELARELMDLLGEQSLYFYDAISPIVSRESLDLEKMFFGSRYDKGTPDFLNIPLSKEQYFEFVEDLLHAEKAISHDFEEERYFESCMPIETIAARGPMTLAFGPMKPVGLIDPKTGKRGFAVIQLRAENEYLSSYNLVGFQTKMKYGEQTRIFRKLPGLENAEFLRLGSIHRNTYINSPLHLNSTLQVRRDPRVFLAGQITGTEGYLESTACGLIAGWNAARIAKGEEPITLPRKTMLGALLSDISNPAKPQPFQPLNVNMGLLPPLENKERDKVKRKTLMGDLAVTEMKSWLESLGSTRRSSLDNYKYSSEHFVERPL